MSWLGSVPGLDWRPPEASTRLNNEVLSRPGIGMFQLNRTDCIVVQWPGDVARAPVGWGSTDESYEIRVKNKGRPQRRWQSSGFRNTARQIIRVSVGSFGPFSTFGARTRNVRR